MPGAQGLEQRRRQPDLSVDETDYFGAPVSMIQNADGFGLRPNPQKDLYRVQYLYLLVFGNERSSTDYGGIQVRASTHLYLEDGQVPISLQRIMQRAAHRGAHLFDSPREEAIYGGGGGEWSDGGGYLSGFTPVENSHEYRNWEVEPVGVPETGDVDTKPRGTTPGRIRWTTEVYLEARGTEYADLSGVAQGISNPYRLREIEEGGTPSVDIPGVKWEIGWEQSRRGGNGEYYVRPPTDRSNASRRYVSGAGAGKTVRVNGQPIGSLDGKGRVWLHPEYGRGDGLTWGDNYSREGLVEETAATYQALRDGGVLYQTGETEHYVDLVTARDKPDGWQEADHSEVPVELEAQEGVEGGVIRLLALADTEEPTTQACRQDDEIIEHLGFSSPPYRHIYAEMWEWPGFRPIAEHGRVVTPADLRDDDDGASQAGLDDYGGGGS